MKRSVENPGNERFRVLGITALAMVIVYVLWNVSQLSIVVYPLRLFVTYVHEAGHSLAALLTGGRVLGFVVSADGSGLATTAGGMRAVIIPAGYLGAALFGSLLFYVANRLPRYVNAISTLLGLGMVLFTVLFARADETGIPLALFLGVGFGVLLIVIGTRLNNWLNLLLLNVLSVMTALNAVLDIWYLTHNISAARGTVANDAVAFTREITPLIPPSVVAFSWVAISVLMLGVAVWYGLLFPGGGGRHEELEAVSLASRSARRKSRDSAAGK